MLAEKHLNYYKKELSVHGDDSNRACQLAPGWQPRRDTPFSLICGDLEDTGWRSDPIARSALLKEAAKCCGLPTVMREAALSQRYGAPELHGGRKANWSGKSQSLKVSSVLCNECFTL